VDLIKFETFSILAHTLANPAIFTERLNGRAYSLNWPFLKDDEAWQKYFEPWNPLALHILYYYGYNEYLQPAIDASCKAKNWREYFYNICEAGVSESTYQALKTRFIKWALPETMKTLSKIATLIEPSQFIEVASLDQAQKSEAKDHEAL
jgi:hypothetical protein